MAAFAVRQRRDNQMAEAWQESKIITKHHSPGLVMCYAAFYHILFYPVSLLKHHMKVERKHLVFSLLPKIIL